MREARLEVPLVNAYLAHKQHLLPGTHGDGVVQVARDSARTWDPLSALCALTARDYRRAPRFKPLLDLFLARQDEQGRWRCGC